MHMYISYISGSSAHKNKQADKRTSRQMEMQ